MKRIIRYIMYALAMTFAITVVVVLLFRWVPVPFSSVMAQRQIEAVFTEEPYVEYKWYAMDEISPNMGLAAIAAEDQNFPNHFGFDLKAIQKAIDEANDGGRSRGASTISQQVAKNMFLWSGRSWVRKGLEVYFTVLIEVLWSKERILEVYVNIAEMGPNVFGVGAASLKYYQREPSKISKRQAATLAASLPNPRRYKVKNPSRYMISRRNWIMRQMDQLGGTALIKSL